jgi:hypothetical protein
MKKKPKFRGYSQTGYGKRSVQEQYKVKDVNEEGGSEYISAWVNNNLNKTQMASAEGIEDLMKGPKLGYNVRKPKRSEPREEDE